MRTHIHGEVVVATWLIDSTNWHWNGLPALSFLLLMGLSAHVAAEGIPGVELVVERKAEQNCVVVVLGASYAKGWDIEQLMGCKVVNKGVGGNESSEMLARFEKDVLALHPRYVLIWGFINDIFRSPQAQWGKVSLNVQANYQKMTELALREKIEPIFATEVTVRGPSGVVESVLGLVGEAMGKKSYQGSINEQVQQTNRWMKGFAASKKLKWLDFEKYLADNDGARNVAFANDDGSHISIDGYQELTSRVRKEGF